LVPLLLDKMAWSGSDELLLQQDDESVPDQAKDIRPFQYVSSSSVDDEDDDAGGYGFGDDDMYDWNLRKCSAAGLDILSNVFQDDLLPHLLPLLEQRLNHQNWRIRETAILALGAVAEGCSRGIKDHLATIIPYLASLLNDENVHLC
jgi:transportin-1